MMVRLMTSRPTTIDIVDEQSFYRPSVFEIATSWVHGVVPLTPLPHVTTTPRAALEAVIGRALRRPPCYVSFSGGRDSSAVLSVATGVARRGGLADPVPLTGAYTGVVRTGR